MKLVLQHGGFQPTNVLTKNIRLSREEGFKYLTSLYEVLVLNHLTRIVSRSYKLSHAAGTIFDRIQLAQIQGDLNYVAQRDPQQDCLFWVSPDTTR